MARHSLGGGEGDSRAGHTGRSGGEGSKAAAGHPAPSGASARAVGSGGKGSRSSTCSLKCVQSVVTPAVSQVLSASRIRCPSLSEQRRKCGPRSARCRGAQRPVHTCPRRAMSLPVPGVGRGRGGGGS